MIMPAKQETEKTTKKTTKKATRKRRTSKKTTKKSTKTAKKAPEKKSESVSSAKQAKKKKKAPASKERIVFTRGKRKEAIARATIRKGKGVVKINKFDLEALNQPYLKSIMQEPLGMAGSLAKDLDIDVNVYGGGPMGQAEAARQAIARGIVEFTGDQELKARMLEIDRHLLSEDSRRVEPKKYKGPKARARFQKSYR